MQCVSWLWFLCCDLTGGLRIPIPWPAASMPKAVTPLLPHRQNSVMKYGNQGCCSACGGAGLSAAKGEDTTLQKPMVPRHSARAAPGDCLQVGPDPPESATVLLDTELGDGAALGDPLLKPPQGYDLLWADDAARPERRLAFWQPVPYEGCEADPRVLHSGMPALNRSPVLALQRHGFAWRP